MIRTGLSRIYEVSKAQFERLREGTHPPRWKPEEFGSFFWNSDKVCVRALAATVVGRLPYVNFLHAERTFVGESVSCSSENTA